MTFDIAIGIGSFVAGVLIVLVFLRKRRTNQTRINLNRFNFDKNKKYEKEGRKFPFSY